MLDWEKDFQGDAFKPQFRPPATPGLGTRIAIVLRRLGVERLVHWWRPQGCGCARRQAWLDKRFPMRWLKRKPIR